MKKNKIIKIEMNEKVGRPLVRSMRAGFYGGGVGGSVADAAQLQTGGVTFQASQIYIAVAAAAATAAAEQRRQPFSLFAGTHLKQ